MDYSGVSFSKYSLKADDLPENEKPGESSPGHSGKNAPLIHKIQARSKEMWSDLDDDAAGLSDDKRALALEQARAAAKHPADYSENGVEVDFDPDEDPDASTVEKTQKLARLADFYRFLGTILESRAPYTRWESISALLNTARTPPEKILDAQTALILANRQSVPQLEDERTHFISLCQIFLSAGTLLPEAPAGLGEEAERLYVALKTAATPAIFFEAFAHIFKRQAAWRDWQEFEGLLGIYQKIVLVQGQQGFDPMAFALSNLQLFASKRCVNCSVPRWGKVCKNCALAG